ncbi:MAG TPA: hypothetical protein VI300_14035 [Solirubrobacter sp.]
MAMVLEALTPVPALAVAPGQWTIEPPRVIVGHGTPIRWMVDKDVAVHVDVYAEGGAHYVPMFIDGQQVFQYNNNCQSPGQVCPLTLPTLTYVIRPSEWSDGPHHLQIEAWDIGYRITKATLDFSVDRTAPAAPTGMALVAQNGWRSENRFAVNWTNPRPDVGSSIVGADYQLCPVATGSTSTSGCITGRRDGVGIDHIDDIAVPQSGVWRLRVGVRDEAGNVDVAGGAVITDIRLDVDPPVLEMLPPDPTDPSRVSLNVSDAEAGIGTVAIEARRHGEDAWHSFETVGTAGKYSAMLDDSQLPAGVYEVRARAIDAVGNERSVTRWTGGAAAEIVLPVRQRTTLTAGVVERRRVPGSSTKRRYRDVLTEEADVAFGKPIALAGRIADGFGHPRGTAPIEIREKLDLAGVEWQLVATVQSDKDGRFSYSAPAGASRAVRFDYPGTATTRSAAGEVTLRVRAGITLETSRRALRNGDAVVLRGRVAGTLPSVGKLVTLQARTSRGWRTFATARAGGPGGRWSYRYEFTQTSVTSRYAFRAVAPQEAAFPYIRGVSAIRTVLVRGSS